MRTHQSVSKKVSFTNTIEKYTHFTNSNNILSKDKLETLLLHIMIVCNWLFNLFENTQFQYFVSKTSDQTCLGRKRMKTLLKNGANETEEKVQTRLTSCIARISLALNCWSSFNSYNFMNIFR
jgi:hypothetical protein